jgi:BspA type Leucine rich repeat region (6 copies)/Domain of unknown function (DUF4347)
MSLSDNTDGSTIHLSISPEPPVPPEPPVLEHKNTPLVYPEITSDAAALITNILLIDSSVIDYQIFVDSVNSSTFPIVYSYNSSKTDLDNLLNTLFSQSTLKRLAFCFHCSGNNPNWFLDLKPLFLNNEVEPYSENVQYLLDLIKIHNISNVDFLACNTLKYDNWKQYFAIFQEKNIVVGASNDPTGNLKYGGDWILESTGQDVEFIYFTSSIEYYSYLLVDFTLDGIIYRSMDPTTAAIIGTDGSIVDMVIPSTITYLSTVYTVYFLANNSFMNTSITSITIPSSITTVGDSVCNGCRSLTSITIQNSTMGNYMFQGCTALSNITIPSSVTNPTSYSFFLCTGLTSVTIQNSVMGSHMFDGCTSLNSVTITGNVTNIASYAFKKCTSLSSFTFPSSVNTISEAAFNYSGLTNITIPSSITTINGYTFTDCINLTTATLQNAVTGYYMFGNWTGGGSGLKSITIPSSITSMGGSEFNSCSNLTSVTIQNNYISSQMFYYDLSLNTVTITGAVTNIDTYAFYSCSSLSILTIPSSVTSLGANAFDTCNKLSYVTFLHNNKLPTIGTNIFANTTSQHNATVISNGAMQTRATGFNYLTGPAGQNPITYLTSAGFTVVSLICFKEDTHILCLVDYEEVYIPIQHIKKGTLVKYLNNDNETHSYLPVELIGSSTIYNPDNELRYPNRLFRCSKENYPELTEDLIITGCHSILVDHLTEEQEEATIEVLGKIKITGQKYRLMSYLDDRAKPFEEEGLHKIWHLSLQNDDIYSNHGIYANGLLVETCSKRMMHYSGIELEN